MLRRYAAIAIPRRASDQPHLLIDGQILQLQSAANLGRTATSKHVGTGPVTIRVQAALEHSTGFACLSSQFLPIRDIAQRLQRNIYERCSSIYRGIVETVLRGFICSRI